MLSINIERIGVNSRLIPTMTKNTHTHTHTHTHTQDTRQKLQPWL